MFLSVCLLCRLPPLARSLFSLPVLLSKYPLLPLHHVPLYLCKGASRRGGAAVEETCRLLPLATRYHHNDTSHIGGAGGRGRGPDGGPLAVHGG